MKLADKLAKMAKANGICEEWHNRLKQTTNKGCMIDMYIRGIDFCLEHNYPSNDFIKEHFKGQGMEEKGVFLDDSIDIKNYSKCVALGKTTGVVVASGHNVSELYVKHDSCLNIVAKDDSFVMVDIYDNATIQVIARDRAKVCINHHGGIVDKCVINDAHVKIREYMKL